jgi:AraC family transcriptional regulator of adaptative response / DNA-3-methyladenine glycosylase II
MFEGPARHLMPPPDVCQRAVIERDARFDGVFFVAVTTTRIYCRPVCPSRRADPRHRRFFPSTTSAEGAGYRPCRRCRPELAPGRAAVDALSRLARAAAHRIEHGALNGRPVTSLAAELGVTERHLRRALQRELGVTPVALAQNHRLEQARRLLADTRLGMTHIAYASGFQSLRRFNAAFRERYGMSPSAFRDAARAAQVVVPERHPQAQARRVPAA